MTYEEKLAYNREYRKKNPERFKAYYQKRQQTPERKEYDRIRSYKRRYGIEYDEYLQMREEQKSCCGICGIHEDLTPSRWGTLCVDHCHTTGQIRKLLCAKCNKGLGCFNDNPELFQKAFEYLKQFEKHKGVAK